jgi:PPM family protein phosphatase
MAIVLTSNPGKGYFERLGNARPIDGLAADCRSKVTARSWPAGHAVLVEPMTNPESSKPVAPYPDASLVSNRDASMANGAAAGQSAASAESAQIDAHDVVIGITARGVTDLGRVRQNNEDNLSVCDLSESDLVTGAFAIDRAVGPLGMLFVLADGMGGQACGELASSMCAEMLPARVAANVRSLGQTGRAELARSLKEAYLATNLSILEASRKQPGCHGMGSTATAAALCGPYLLVAQVGDSRAYLLRNGSLVQLTRDQTFLNYLVDMGAVEPAADISDDPRRSILVQAMGTNEQIHMALTGTEVRQGDRLLLCCDGLYSMVRPEQLLEIAGRDGDLSNCCRSLIETANSQGGADNITAILVEFSGEGLQPRDATAEVRVEAISSPD